MGRVLSLSVLLLSAASASGKYPLSMAVVIDHLEIIVDRKVTHRGWSRPVGTTTYLLPGAARQQSCFIMPVQPTRTERSRLVMKATVSRSLNRRSPFKYYYPTTHHLVAVLLL